MGRKKEVSEQKRLISWFILSLLLSAPLRRPLLPFLANKKKMFPLFSFFQSLNPQALFPILQAARPFHLSLFGRHLLTIVHTSKLDLGKRREEEGRILLPAFPQKRHSEIFPFLIIEGLFLKVLLVEKRNRLQRGYRSFLGLFSSIP